MVHVVVVMEKECNDAVESLYLHLPLLALCCGILAEVIRDELFRLDLTIWLQ